uniref:TonB-dependent receptor domain-containing protein n=1 Tax=Rheinheimera sp. TaxID=1869214 RepID=UPI00307EE1D7
TMAHHDAVYSEVSIPSSLEWYFADASLASVNLFHRELDHVLFSSVTTVGDSRFDTDGIDRSGYDYSTTLNGGSGHLTGLELTYIQPWDFLPESLQGFGMQFNYALLDSEFATPDGRKVALPGTSDRVMNSTFFYENYGWSVRVNYQWRDQWLDDISYEATGDIYWQDSKRVDLSVRYQLTDQVSVYADLNNITDEGGERFEGDASRPIEVEGFGRRYMAGVKVSF